MKNIVLYRHYNFFKKFLNMGQTHPAWVKATPFYGSSVKMFLFSFLCANTTSFNTPEGEK